MDASGNPNAAQAGSVTGAAYSPLARIGGTVYNAPIVAPGETPHDITFASNRP